VHDLVGTPRGELAVVVAVAVWWLVNNLLVGAVVATTVDTRTALAGIGDRESLAIDAVDVSMGVLATIAFVTRPELLLVLAAPVLYLQHHAFSRLRDVARTDQLTEVASAAYWRDVAGRAVERARASNQPVTVLLVDLDHFKAVNDGHGHSVGDVLLAAVSRAIVGAVRPSDLVGRLGGEEFAVLVGSSRPEAEGVAERICADVAAAQVRAADGRWVGVTASVGLAALDATATDLPRLLARADAAMYAAKAAGRNRVRVADGEPDPVGQQVIDLTRASAAPAFPGMPGAAAR
jgi:diguanylate cyclase (GGDEF)-like protein